ncbi:hypothetical protein KQX54_008367 [Cotesia glomerata]|uniref:Uncharacterized protein n=1 Tax=Cotesia glomerata TaxID=32391 RepID=A0AAV7J3S9_COTGL|nr:hypothetical protein KQX54_008367 [Cotesia glomerata]
MRNKKSTLIQQIDFSSRLPVEFSLGRKEHCPGNPPGSCFPCIGTKPWLYWSRFFALYLILYYIVSPRQEREQEQGTSKKHDEIKVRLRVASGDAEPDEAPAPHSSLLGVEASSGI